MTVRQIVMIIKVLNSNKRDLLLWNSGGERCLKPWVQSYQLGSSNKSYNTLRFK
ncbi:hypothetical protein O181_017240, partial [Austropuccinia psidii MF-1]|nr:hypothetical protein [Austropuccinia psidii MF-1]